MIWNNQSMHCKSPDKLCKSAKGATGIGSTGKLYYKQEEGVGGRGGGVCIGGSGIKGQLHPKLIILFCMIAGK